MLAIQRFLKKIKKIKNGCWEWQAGLNERGYGTFYDKQNIRAHRFSYQYYVGKIPEGYTIDHLCRNRKCVNPKHLEPVTNKENVLRGNGLTAINARKTHCLRGHELKGDNLILKKLKSGTARNCRICKKESLKQWRASKRQTIQDRYKEELNQK